MQPWPRAIPSSPSGCGGLRRWPCRARSRRCHGQIQPGLSAPIPPFGGHEEPKRYDRRCHGLIQPGQPGQWTMQACCARSHQSSSSTRIHDKSIHIFERSITEWQLNSLVG
uniref:Predicted protein n=1 Tax=Hordeum vulgare subsp. vulgare TaxID=112509 RepID=F2DSM2_HORVV|nr:predicted protein [Hordeum vulgare subsp. vulgare]